MSLIRRAGLVAALLATIFTSRAQAPTAAVSPVAAPPAQPTSTCASATTPSGGHPLEAADLDAFFDGIFPLQLERSDIAGASVLVMKDGAVLLE